VILVAVVLALVLGAVVVVRHAYFEGLEPVSSTSQELKLVTIQRGSTLNQIADQLNRAGLIRSPWAFKLYVGSKNVREALQAGTYSFSPSQNVAQIVVQLSHGKVATDLVAIVPGQRLGQIQTTLANYGFKDADIQAAMNPALYAGNPALVDKPASASLEGYIYPDSYQKNFETKPHEIIESALAEMNNKLTPDLRSAFAAQGLSTYEAIILASIVEKEVSNPTDRPQVAQVFLLRLRIGMMLGSDVTAYYGSHLAGVEPSVSYDSPYNTRLHAGLPPTPISNVTISSLQAVAHPASTDWLYFVSGDDGVTHFAHTLDEHHANTVKYCHKLCSQ
jgi:UPF0755 protein